MIRWPHHFLRNPTRHFMLFYTMLIWRVLTMYYGITALNLLAVLLLTLVCYVLYGVFRDLSRGRSIPLSLGILLICLPVVSLLSTHITLALYLTEGVSWVLDPAPLVALYPVLLLFLLMLQDRYFHPIGAAVSLPFVLFSWFTLIQDQLKVWIILYLFIILIESAAWVFARARRKGRQQGWRMMPKKRMMITTALVFVFALPALFFPLSALGTRSLDDILSPDRVPSRITEFDLHSLGYGDKATLGGPIKLDDTPLMTVEAGSPLYLRGDVKDQYTGHAWIKTWRDFDRQGEYAVHEIDKESQLYLDTDVSEMRIYPAAADANALFTPLNALYVYANTKVWYDRYYIFYNISRRHRTDPYTVLYKDITYDPFYDYPMESVRDTGAYGPYLTLPDTVTRRTIDLVEEITADAGTASEKVDAICGYLMENYTYSLFMTTPPEDVDFVDHFLFTEHKGYCTYFATGAAVMCRIAGVPSRYVQGFLLDPYNVTPEGLYRLSGEEGHAWIEVLVSPEDRLWASVECTPGWNSGPGSSDVIPEAAPPPVMNDVPVDMPGSTSGRRKGIIGEHPFLFALILLLTIGLVSLAVIWTGRRIRRWKSLFTDPSILPLYARIRTKLIKTGIFTDTTLTDMDHATAVTDGTLRGYLLPIVSQYYDEIYGGIRRDCGIDRREAYRYITKYARRNMHS